MPETLTQKRKAGAVPAAIAAFAAVIAFLVAGVSGPAKAAASGKSVPDAVIVKYPRPDALLKNRRPMTGADFQPLLDSGVVYSPQLFLDGADVTAVSDIAEGYIFYTPGADLSAGAHTIKLVVSGGGRTVYSSEWKFTIAGAKPLKLAYPAPDATTQNSIPVIGFGLSELPEGLDPKTVKMFVDGKDVTARTDVTADYIFFTAAKELSAGPHKIEVKANNLSGGGQGAVSWKFTVSPTAVARNKVKPKESGAATAKKPPPAGTIKVKKPVVAGAPGSATATKPIEKAVAAQPKAENKKPAAAKPKNSAAAAVSKAGPKNNSVAKAAEIASAVFGPPPESEASRQVKIIYTAQQPGGAQTAPASTPGTTIAPEVEATGGGKTEYAMETTYGFEDTTVAGAVDLSSQRPKNAFVYRFGIRTQSPMSSMPVSLFKGSSFNVNFKMDGTSDGDETESFWDVKRMVASLVDDKKTVNVLDIQPKFTSYTLSGTWLNGAQLKLKRGENGATEMFYGAYKKPRAGKEVKLSGLRLTGEKHDGFTYGAQVVSANLFDVRTGDSPSNTVMGFNVEKKYARGDTKFEGAVSQATSLGDDRAYRLENTYRKKKLALNSSYENVGSYFRSEGGFSSYGLVEFRSSAQYQFSKKFTTVAGVWRRSFREGGSHTVSVPVMMRFIPFKSRPSTTMEYRYKLSYYDKGSAWKDTFTNSVDLGHKLRKYPLQFSLKEEKTERNSTAGERERSYNFSMSAPVTKKTTLIYKMSQLNDNLFGAESKNNYAMTYELSDWSDIRLSMEKVNKDQATLDRTTRKLRFGKVNPNTNTEMSFELNRNEYLLYDETMLDMKYSIFY